MSIGIRETGRSYKGHPQVLREQTLPRSGIRVAFRHFIVISSVQIASIRIVGLGRVETFT